MVLSFLGIFSTRCSVSSALSAVAMAVDSRATVATEILHGSCLRQSCVPSCCDGVRPLSTSSLVSVSYTGDRLPDRSGFFSPKIHPCEAFKLRCPGHKRPQLRATAPRSFPEIPGCCFYTFFFLIVQNTS